MNTPVDSHLDPEDATESGMLPVMVPSTNATDPGGPPPDCEPVDESANRLPPSHLSTQKILELFDRPMRPPAPQPDRRAASDGGMFVAHATVSGPARSANLSPGVAAAVVIDDVTPLPSPEAPKEAANSDDPRWTATDEDEPDVSALSSPLPPNVAAWVKLERELDGEPFHSHAKGVRRGAWPIAVVVAGVGVLLAFGVLRTRETRSFSNNEAVQPTAVASVPERVAPRPEPAPLEVDASVVTTTPTATPSRTKVAPAVAKKVFAPPAPVPSSRRSLPEQVFDNDPF